MRGAADAVTSGGCHGDWHGGAIPAPSCLVSTVVCGAAEKQRLSRLTGAVALDMESAAIGTAARSRAFPLPFAGPSRTWSGKIFLWISMLFLKPSGLDARNWRDRSCAHQA